jgi:hypothetical protein
MKVTVFYAPLEGRWTVSKVLIPESTAPAPAAVPSISYNSRTKTLFDGDPTTNPGSKAAFDGDRTTRPDGIADEDGDRTTRGPDAAAFDGDRTTQPR